MKILIAGGGTGGHVYPGLALVRALSRHETAYAGSFHGLEKKALAGYSIPFYPISSRGLVGKNFLKKIAGIFFTALGFFQSLQLLLRMKPGVVIGTGGYVSSPVLLAACFLRTPTILLEQNLLPGKTTRFFSRFVSRVLVSFEESKAYLPNADVEVTGNPVRPEIGKISKEQGCRQFAFSPERPVIAFMGASQGARAINRLLLRMLPLMRNHDWQILHLTGKAHAKEVEEESKTLLPAGTPDYRCIPFSEKMEAVYGASDLIVSRAGATTLAEIMAAGKPSILIPFPFAAENHQELNARWLEKQGGCRVTLETEATPELLLRQLEELLGNSSRREEMGKKAKQASRSNATEAIVSAIEELSGRTA